MAAAPTGRITRLPGVGHMPIFERPGAVIDAIRDVERRTRPVVIEPRPLPAADTTCESVVRAPAPEPSADPNLTAALIGARTI